MSPWGPDDGRWRWVTLAALVAMTLAIMFGGAVFGQGGDPRPSAQTIPIMGIDTSGRFVLVGDLTNHALRVNVVAGSGSGVSGTIGQTFPTTVAPAGARDAGGFTASLTVTNAGRLNVTCDNCSSSAATFAAAFPANGGAIGFKDGGGMMASATVDNAGNIFVIASQSSSSWTVTATGTISAHQADTWTVTCSNCSGASTTNFGAAFPASGSAVGFKDGAGRFASAVVDNASNLFVIASQGQANANQPWFATGTISAHQSDAWTVTAVPSTAFVATFPSVGYAVGFKDGVGRMASGTVDNASNIFVIASQGTANSGQAWFVNLSQVNGTTTATAGVSGLLAVGGNTATGSQAAGNPVRVSGVVRFATPSYTDGQVQDFTLTTAGSLRTRDDASGATNTLAPGNVMVVGGWGKSATVTQVTACDNFATITMGWQSGNQQIITGAAGHQVRICSMLLITASATAISIIEGSGTLCNTNKSAIFGSAATINGLNLATNGGLTMGTGVGEIGRSQMTGNNVCIANSTSAVVSGGITWTRY
jgi:hypothetical protein